MTRAHEFFFDFDGRFSRSQFWLASLVYVFAALTVVGISFVAGKALPQPLNSFVTVAVLIGVGVAALWSSLAVTVKRFHDRGKSGRWLWVWFALPLILNFLVGSISKGSQFLPILIQVIEAALGLWFSVEVGVLRGIEGGNIYGVAPIAD